MRSNSLYLHTRKIQSVCWIPCRGRDNTCRCTVLTVISLVHENWWGFKLWWPFPHHRRHTMQFTISNVPSLHPVGMALEHLRETFKTFFTLNYKCLGPAFSYSASWKLLFISQGTYPFGTKLYNFLFWLSISLIRLGMPMKSTHKRDALFLLWCFLGLTFSATSVLILLHSFPPPPPFFFFGLFNMVTCLIQS